MKVIQTTSYVCEVCGSEHALEQNAIACEAAPVPEQELTVGDKVVVRERRICGSISGPDKEYVAVGRVKEVHGPVRGDEGLFNKWLGGAPGPFFHVWQYVVEFQCPHCERIKTALYHARELERYQHKSGDMPEAD